jgi:hypothetical protein
MLVINVPFTIASTPPIEEGFKKMARHSASSIALALGKTRLHFARLRLHQHGIERGNFLTRIIATLEFITNSSVVYHKSASLRLTEQKNDNRMY